MRPANGMPQIERMLCCLAQVRLQDGDTPDPKTLPPADMWRDW